MSFPSSPFTRAAGLTRLAQFVPHAGHDYATGRNFDLGEPSHISGLSPWIRHRLLLEQEVFAAALEQHSFAAAEKFLQEVVWRTYWKGWLEMRPQVWRDYCTERDQLLAHQNGAQTKALAQAEQGQTGIDCFDHWAQQLVETGYLHNHSRMWFASIWIFTLQLPWQLGADFFLRHLLDGDAASNTLSWRWVAGLQTVGKHYLASAANIRKFTRGQFDPRNQLNEHAPAMVSDREYPKQPLPVISPPNAGLKTALLITEDDLYPESLPLGLEIEGVALVATTHARSPRPVSKAVKQLVQQAFDDCTHRVTAHFGQTPELLSAEQLTDWQHQYQQVICPQLATGPTQDALAQIHLPLVAVPRDWDQQLWPHATHGFFRFKKCLPDLADRLSRQGHQ